MAKRCSFAFTDRLLFRGWKPSSSRWTIERQIINHIRKEKFDQGLVVRITVTDYDLKGSEAGAEFEAAVYFRCESAQVFVKWLKYLWRLTENSWECRDWRGRLVTQDDVDEEGRLVPAAKAMLFPKRRSLHKRLRWRSSSDVSTLFRRRFRP